MVQSFELSNNFAIVRKFPNLVDPSVPTILGRFVSRFVEVPLWYPFLVCLIVSNPLLLLLLSLI